MGIGTKIGLGLVGLLVVLGGCGVASYNSLASGDQECDAKWSDIDVAYQRRNDLVPNIVATCKAFLSHELEVFKTVNEAQASVGKTTIDPKNITPEQLEKWSQAQAGLGGALQKLMMVTFSQPNIKGDQGLQDLRVTLEGCENRISVARHNYNDEAKAQNSRIVTFPNNMLFSKFQKRAFFQADTAARTAPKVDFGTK